MSTTTRRSRGLDPTFTAPEDSAMNRLAVVETHVGHLITQTTEMRADIRTLSSKIDNVVVLLAGMNIASTLGLAALMARGFHWF